MHRMCTSFLFLSITFPIMLTFFLRLVPRCYFLYCARFLISFVLVFLCVSNNRRSMKNQATASPWAQRVRSQSGTRRRGSVSFRNRPRSARTHVTVPICLFFICLCYALSLFICVYMSDMHAFSPHHMPEHSIFNPTDFYLPISPDVACGGLTGRGMAACASYGGGGAPCSDGRCGGPGLGAYLHS